ncbi:DUF6518 family protein [Cellulosimicrobium cellulans]|uniref:DUF6518 family protein n=1 Tax=Cellulosimicrobium cellulans TaxID=1710 RepID=UPI0008490F5F|nr:DUF6518 family protein [Cellulosimicrobium cellulans]
MPFPPSSSARSSTDRTAPVVRSALVLAASLALGALTFVLQGALPDAVRSFANSASGWTVVTVLLVLWSRAGTALAAVLGAASFVLLTLGYTAAAYASGLAYDPLLFSVVGVIVGPFVGVGASWLRSPGRRAALGTAVLAGIGLGEAAYGLTVVAATTSAVYWVAIGVLALALLGVMLARRLPGAAAKVIAVVGSVVVAGAFLLAYQFLGA